LLLLPPSLESVDSSLVGEILAIGNPRPIKVAIECLVVGPSYPVTGPVKRLMVAKDAGAIKILSLVLVGCHSEHTSQVGIRADAEEVAGRLAEQRLRPLRGAKRNFDEIGAQRPGSAAGSQAKGGKSSGKQSAKQLKKRRAREAANASGATAASDQRKSEAIAAEVVFVIPQAIAAFPAVPAAPKATAAEDASFDVECSQFQ
jgi:hypothetical protein